MPAPNAMGAAVKVVGLTQAALSSLAEANQETYHLFHAAYAESAARQKALEDELQAHRNQMAEMNRAIIRLQRENDDYLDDIAMLIERRSK